VDDLDVNPRFLNVENSTVDLNTGELLPHPKEDIITKLAKVRYDRERCVQVPGVSVRIRELFKAYQEWCDTKRKD
jgi:phage/plasmid-associated DNA primase